MLFSEYSSKTRLNPFLLSDFSLGPLVGKVKDYQVEVIVDTLCSNMVGDKEQLRDISSIGLKTVINELPLTTQTLAATGKRLVRAMEYI